MGFHFQKYLLCPNPPPQRKIRGARFQKSSFCAQILPRSGESRDTPEGLIEDRAIPILEEIGEWLGRCGEAIYSTRITKNYNDGNIWFNASKDGQTLYAIYALKDEEVLPATLTWNGNLPKGGKVTILNNGKKVKATVKDGVVTVKLPKGMKQEPVALKFGI